MGRDMGATEDDGAPVGNEDDMGVCGIAAGCCWHGMGADAYMYDEGAVIGVGYPMGFICVIGGTAMGVRLGIGAGILGKVDDLISILGAKSAAGFPCWMF